MSTPTISRKRQQTRDAISTVATRLFAQRGFDRVTVDDVAAAAGVGRMTVFNHFPRKEDLFFDRDGESREQLREALRGRDPRVAPVEALRLFTHRLMGSDSPYVRFTAASRGFMATIAASAALQARARAIRDELAQVLAAALAEDAGRDPADADARLAAGLLVATWSVAFAQAHDVYRRQRSATRARAVFLALIDRGACGVGAAMAGTPYA